MANTERERVEWNGRDPVLKERMFGLTGAGPDGAAPTGLYCENETNNRRLFGVPGSTPYPKDGINDHVVGGAATVNPDRHGTKGVEHLTKLPATLLDENEFLSPHGQRARS